MATAQHPSTPTLRPGVQPLRAGQGHSFFWRKLHSLSGIVPIGAFLIEHISPTSRPLNGPLAYAAQVKFLNCLPLVRVLEWVFIFIPLAYPRALRRLHRLPRPRPTSTSTPGPATGCTSPSAITGLIAFVYIIQHVWRQRFMRRQPSRAPRRSLRTRSSTNSPTPGCSPSTSSP